MIFISIYILLLLVLEYLYYFKKIRIKSEKEALANSYDWFDFTMHPDNFDTKRGDLSEGLYDGNYKLSAESAMKKKYDTYYNYLRLQPDDSPRFRLWILPLGQISQKKRHKRYRSHSF